MRDLSGATVSQLPVPQEKQPQRDVSGSGVHRAQWSVTPAEPQSQPSPDTLQRKQMDALL